MDKPQDIRRRPTTTEQGETWTKVEFKFKAVYVQFLFELTFFKYRHYSSLPRQLIVRVYHRYRIDFEMFDYSIDDVLIKAGYEPLLQHEANKDYLLKYK